MIYKFKDLDHPDHFIEFFKCDYSKGKMTIQITNDENKTFDLNLNKEQLFELIGGLLRIQSKMEKNG